VSIYNESSNTGISLANTGFAEKGVWATKWLVWRDEVALETKIACLSNAYTIQ
jgi:hypothetical protein